MIWSTVSSRSCFCWLYRASPSLATKNIISLISVLTIWWCPCVESSRVVGRGCLLRLVCSLGKTLLTLALLSEKAMAPHSSTPAWKIPGQRSLMGCSPWDREESDTTSLSLSLFTFMIGEGNGNPLQCSCLENPKDGGAWCAAVYGVAQSRTRLKWLSSSSSSSPTLVCTLRPNLPATPGISWLPTFALQCPVIKRTSFFGVSSRRFCTYL